MRSYLLNQRGARFSIWAWIVYGAICALLGMIINSYADVLVKQQEGPIISYTYQATSGAPISDSWEVLSGTWTTVGGYPQGQNGEIRFVTDYVTLPNYYAIHTVINQTSADAGMLLKFYYQNSNNYYFIDFSWSGSRTNIMISKMENGTRTDLTSWVICGAQWNNCSLLVYTTSSGIYVKTDQGYTASWSGTPIWNNGEVRVQAPYTYNIQVLGFRLFRNRYVNVTNLPTGYKAVLCSTQRIQVEKADGFNSNLYGTSSGTGRVAIGQSMSFNSNRTLSRVVYFLKRTGSPTGTISVKLYDGASWPSNIIAISTETIDVTTIPTSAPREYIFTFSQPLAGGSNYYAILEGDTIYQNNSSSSNRIDIVQNVNLIGDQTSSSTYWAKTTSWASSTGQDLIFQIETAEYDRYSTTASSGTASIEIVDIWNMSLNNGNRYPIRANLKIGNASWVSGCTTNIVAETGMMYLYIGESWQYVAGRKLQDPPRQGWTTSTETKIWVHGDSFSGGTQVAKVQYTTGNLSDCPTGCTTTSGVTLASSNNYMSAIKIIGLSPNQTYNAQVLIDDVIQSGSSFVFTTLPSEGAEIVMNVAWASCLSEAVKPFYHMDVATSLNAKIVIIHGDAAYPDWPIGENLSPITGRDYAVAYLSTIRNYQFMQMLSGRIVIFLYDDHEFHNDYYGKSGWVEAYQANKWYGESQEERALEVWMQFFGVANPTTVSEGLLNAGTNIAYFKWQVGRVGFIMTDSILYKDDADATDSKTVYSTGSVTATNGSSIITCSGCDWVTAGVSSGDPVRLDFTKRWYLVSSIDSAMQITLQSAVSCSTCFGTHGVITNMKTMLGMTQFADFLNAVNDYDNNSNIDLMVWVSSKTGRFNPRGTGPFDDYSFYNQEFNEILTYFKDYTTKKPRHWGGDIHQFWFVKDTVVDPNGLYLINCGAGASPNIGGELLTTASSDLIGRFVNRRGICVTRIDTTQTPIDTYDLYDERQKLLWSLQPAGNSNYSYVVENFLQSNRPTNYPGQYKIARDSQGYCYILYYNGTNYVVEASQDTACTTWFGNAVTLPSAYGDDDNGGPSMFLYEGAYKKLYFAYLDSVQDIGYARTACLHATDCTQISSPPAITLQNDETTFGGVAGYPIEDVEIAVASDGAAWVTFTRQTTQGSNEGNRIKRASCGTECVTSWANNLVVEDSLTNVGGRSILPLTGGNVLHTWVENGTLYWQKCSTSSCPIKASLGSIYTGSENFSNGSGSGWQPDLAHDGSGGAGLVYRNGTAPNRITFRKFDGSNWGSEIIVGNNETSPANWKQTSPSIVMSNNKFYVGWLQGSFADIVLYKSASLTPTAANQFASISAPNDGWNKTRFFLIASSSKFLISYARMFGINYSGAYSQLMGRLTSTPGGGISVIYQLDN